MSRTLAAILAAPENDRVVLRAIGLILAGALILGWAALRFLDTIGV